MRTKITDFIPTTAPHLLYEEAVPTAGPDDVFDPVIAGDLVLVTLDPYEFVSDRFIRAFAGQKAETEHQDSSERPVQHVGWTLLRRKPETFLPSPGYQCEPYPDQKTILQAVLCENSVRTAWHWIYSLVLASSSEPHFVLLSGPILSLRGK